MTSSAWPVTLTLRHAFSTFPSVPIRNVLRSIPMYFRPYIDFSTHVPYRSATACSSSDASGKVSPYLAANRSIGLLLVRHPRPTPIRHRVLLGRRKRESQPVFGREPLNRLHLVRRHADNIKPDRLQLRH